MSYPIQVILLSGGLDSVVNLSIAAVRGRILAALTFDYGQRAARREIEASRMACDHYSVPHRIIRLPWMEKITSSALVRKGEELPELSLADLQNPERTEETARAVWVPNRNGVFLQIAAAVAEAGGGDTLVAGFNREEAGTFPDNSGEFLRAVNQSLAFSTLNSVRAVSYTLEMDKSEIIKAALRHKAPLDVVWSCYRGGEIMCGRCESCRRLRRALAGTEAETLFRGRFEG